MAMNIDVDEESRLFKSVNAVRADPDGKLHRAGFDGKDSTPLKGFTQTKDLGMAAAFLASDAARFITGIDLVVDGGISSVFLL